MHSVKPITAVIDACKLSNFSIQKQPRAMCMHMLFFKCLCFQIPNRKTSCSRPEKFSLISSLFWHQVVFLFGTEGQ